jgi:hypothetical protein
MTAAGVMTCLKFLKNPNTNFDTYYIGEIYKEQTFNLFSGMKSIAKFFAGYQEFISYKFTHTVDSTTYTFIITFRKMHTTNKYHIRLSILPENDLRCERKRFSIKLTYDGSLEFPEDEGNEGSLNRNFTSIYKGQWVGDAIVKNMREKNDDEISQEIKTVVKNIKGKMDKLGQILVDECMRFTQWQNLPNPVGGGYTRKPKRLTYRRKSVLKRKNKKSYKKKNYGKSNKIRRFRRSVRSRR